MNPHMKLGDAIAEANIDRSDVRFIEEMILANEQPRTGKMALGGAEGSRLDRERLIRQDVLKKIHKLIT